MLQPRANPTFPWPADEGQPRVGRGPAGELGGDLRRIAVVDEDELDETLLIGASTDSIAALSTGPVRYETITTLTPATGPPRCDAAVWSGSFGGMGMVACGPRPHGAHIDHLAARSAARDRQPFVRARSGS